MKPIEYRTRDKSEWGPGPWQDEPDKVQYVDEATGLPCLIVRNQFGSLCGYVGVAPGHPLYDCADPFALDLDVHGGITFGDKCQPTDDPSHGVCHVPEPGEPEPYWLGFDCGHHLDVSPAMEYLYNEIGLDNYPHALRRYYRDVAYVKAECARLAQQVASYV